MGVRVRTAPTPPGWWGVYDHKRRLITMKPQLALIQYECTLFHELGHAHYGHVGVTGKQEMLANRWAAHRLIDFESLIEYAATEQSSTAVAAAVGVLPSVLQTYLETLTRVQLNALREAALKVAA